MSTTFYNFLQQIDSSLVREYSLERYKNGETGKHNYQKPTFENAKTRIVFREKLQLESIDSLPDDHFAKVYVKQRQIPDQFHSQLYYAPDFKKFISSLGIEKDTLFDNDQRLVIPFYDKDKTLIAVQGRSLVGNSKLRYITLKIDSENDKLYGLDRVDWNKKVYVVEGPIDSMFVPNCIATSDSHLMKVKNSDNVVLVFDNEPRNRAIVDLIEQAIDKNYSVCLWPNTIEQKDINDMIRTGITQSQILSIIDSNTFSGLRAKMEFVNWKKI